MTDTTVRIDAIRMPRFRDSNGSCLELSRSIEREGLHRPVVLWRDGTLISGGRRIFAQMLLDRQRTGAVFVDTIEDAAKRLHGDDQEGQIDKTYLPPKWSEVCRLWETLRRLDAPAAAKRADAARRRGVELRRQTQSGKRPAGRSSSRSDDYVLGVICQPFGISSATARRIEVIYETATGKLNASDAEGELARQIMIELDSGASIWASYQKLLDARPGPRRVVKTPAPAAPPPAPGDPVSGAKQIAAFERSLPTMEGLVSALVGMGAPHPDLTWAEIGPIHTRLAAVRRELEKMIKQMKETNKQ